MKKIMKICLASVLALSLVGCQKEKQEEFQYFKDTVVGPFDTVTTYITYAKNEEEFKEQSALIKQRLEYYDKLFDKYTKYDDISNVYTINEKAGKEAVEVSQELIDVIEFSIEKNETVSDKVNIALGSVITIWHNYREAAEDNNGVGDVPTKKELEEAAKHTNLKDIHIDKEKKTVYLADPLMSLDLGATAKGYAIELIKQELIDKGIDNFLLSGGGNVASHGERKIEREGDFYLDECSSKYCVGIQSPQDGNYASDTEENVATLVVQGESIVTSGDYQRFYKDIEGVTYHHLIDPETLFPAVYFRSVSIVTKDSGLADFLSSALFLMNYEEGLELIDSLEDVEAIWLLEDGKVKMSSGLKDNENIYVIEKERLD